LIEVKLHPRASLDLSAATRYYRVEAGRDVAERFFAEFQRCTDFLREHPEGAPAVGPEGVRRKLLQGFPYAIHYILRPDRAYIVSVAHQRRAPEHLLERLKP